jgi:alkaline phosphatase D
MTFAIASCQRWDHGYFSAWRHLADEAPDLVVFLGDYIYEYPPAQGGVRVHEGHTGAHTLDQYRARYAQYKSDPDLQRIHAITPWLVTWDDHEVSNDYANDQSESLGNVLKRRAAAYQAWWEHMPMPPATRPNGPNLRIFERFDWGGLARFHVLDDRQYRDAQACPPPGRGGSNTVFEANCPELSLASRSMLGADQERWLSAGLAPNDIRWNLLAQQTLMAPFTWDRNPRYWTDGWSGYPAARERLLATLAERRTPNPVVLGGDVHANYVADLSLRPGGPLVATEFCGTSISSRGMDQARLDAALPLNPHLRYGRSDERGYVRFQLSATGLDASLRVVSDAQDPRATVRTAARFHVEAGRAGAQRSA